MIHNWDNACRPIRCATPEGTHQIHELHLEEGEFAMVLPVGGALGNSMLLLHKSQLELLDECKSHPS
ncbi:hypothetical protein [Halomonas borealis]|uniref:hypothetical protein n=1 Tax=Halomonas borealis TaxID=2508710 RepID=UPI001F0FDCC9|nr:hypothetical protein [Halomonas borealis]